MKVLLSISLCFALASAMDNASPFSPLVKKFINPQGAVNNNKPALPMDFVYDELKVDVDPFNPQDNRKFELYYYGHDDFWQPDSPIFIYISDFMFEGYNWLYEGLFHDIAKEVNATMFVSSHRFFNYNIPTDSASFVNLRYLTVENALNDIAQLIKLVKMAVSPRGRVILTGDGYGATLATYARIRFPHLVDAVWSSGGVFYSDIFSEHYFTNFARNLYAMGGDVCFDTVREAFDIIESLANEEGIDRLTEELRLCTRVDPDNEQHVVFAIDILAQVIVQYTMYTHVSGIRSFCGVMTDKQPGEDALDRLGIWIDGLAGTEFCRNIDYDDAICLIKSADWNNLGSVYGIRQATYMACTQLGHFPINERMNSTYNIFGNRITERFYRNFCDDAFGEEYNFYNLQPTLANLLLTFGGQEPQLTKAIFSNGQLDVFNSYGITEKLNDEVEVHSVPYFGRYGDRFSINETDYYDVREIRQAIRDTLYRWATE